MAETPIARATLLMKGLLMNSTSNFVGTYSAGASSKAARQPQSDADRLSASAPVLSIPLRPDLPNNCRRNARWRFSPYASRIGETRSTLPMAQVVSTRELCPECFCAAADAFRRISVDSDMRSDPKKASGNLQQYLSKPEILSCRPGTAALAPKPRCRFLTARKLWYSRWGLSAIPARRVYIWRANRLSRSAGDSDYWRWRAAHDSEMGSMLRDGQAPVILLLNNDGYTAERHSRAAQRYNHYRELELTQIPPALLNAAQQAGVLAGDAGYPTGGGPRNGWRAHNVCHLLK